VRLLPSMVAGVLEVGRSRGDELGEESETLLAEERLRVRSGGSRGQRRPLLLQHEHRDERTGEEEQEGRTQHVLEHREGVAERGQKPCGEPRSEDLDRGYFAGPEAEVRRREVLERPP